MALETPTAPAPRKEAVSLQPPPPLQGEPPPSSKPGRIRNEYPEVYDQLEELERSSVTKHTDNQPAAEKPAKTDRDSTGKFTKKPEMAADLKPEAKPPGAKDDTAEPDQETATEKTEKAPPAKPDDGKLAADDPTAKFATAHDLRKDWRKQRQLVEERDTEIANLRKQLETRGPETKTLGEENKRLRARLDEVESELRYADYTKSQEFKDKFEKPYQDAYEDAVEEVKELRVQLPDGQSRPATSQDFQRILQADTQDVREIAREMFGEAATDVLAIRRRLVELNKNANREAKRYREQAAEREREKALKSTEQAEQAKRLFQQANESLLNRYKDYFGEKEGDDEYNQELQAGYAAVDKAFQPGLPIEERISRQAALRHRAAAFRTQVLLNKRLSERVKELEGVVAEYEKSAPGSGKGGSEGNRVNGSAAKSAFEELEELDRLEPADR